MRFDGIILKPLARFAAMGTLCLSAACAMLPAWAEALAEHHSHEWDRDDEDDDTIEMRHGAGRHSDNLAVICPAYVYADHLARRANAPISSF